MKKKLLFVFNPWSGKGQIKNQLFDVVDIFVKQGYEVVVHPTQRPMDAHDLVRLSGKEYDRIVCSGGDGTLDEVVSGVVQGKVSCPIGYIPAGSTNDFANSIGIPKDYKDAARIAAGTHPFACDIGDFNGNNFVYIAAFGLFTDVSYETSQSLKNVLGHAAYILEGMKKIIDIPSYRIRVEVNDEVIEEEFIFGMISNSEYVGGMKGIAGREVNFADGLFEVVLIRTPKNVFELNEILAWLANHNLGTKMVYECKASNVTLTSEKEISWTLDGEAGGAYTKSEISIIPHAYQIMVGEDNQKRMEDGETK